MQTYTQVFANEVKKLIEERINASVEELAFPPGAQDYAHYRHLTGVIEGLRRSLQCFEEAEERLREEEGSFTKKKDPNERAH